MSGPVSRLPIAGACISAGQTAAGPSVCPRRLFPHRCLSTPPLVCIIALLAACGTTALKPEPKLVSSVTSLPPVQVPIPVRCVKEVPPMPSSTVDPNAPVLARYYQMRALLAEQDEALIRHHAALLACAAEEPKP